MVDIQLFKLDNFMCALNNFSKTEPVFPTTRHPQAVEISYTKTVWQMRFKGYSQDSIEAILLKVGFWSE